MVRTTKASSPAAAARRVLAASLLLLLLMASPCSSLRPRRVAAASSRTAATSSAAAIASRRLRGGSIDGGTLGNRFPDSLPLAAVAAVPSSSFESYGDEEIADRRRGRRRRRRLKSKEKTDDGEDEDEDEDEDDESPPTKKDTNDKKVDEADDKSGASKPSPGKKDSPSSQKGGDNGDIDSTNGVGQQQGQQGEVSYLSSSQLPPYCLAASRNQRFETDSSQLATYSYEIYGQSSTMDDAIARAEQVGNHVLSWLLRELVVPTCLALQEQQNQLEGETAAKAGDLGLRGFTDGSTTVEPCGEEAESGSGGENGGEEGPAATPASSCYRVTSTVNVHFEDVNVDVAEASPYVLAAIQDAVDALPRDGVILVSAGDGNGNLMMAAPCGGVASAAPRRMSAAGIVFLTMFMVALAAGTIYGVWRYQQKQSVHEGVINLDDVEDDDGNAVDAAFESPTKARKSKNPTVAASSPNNTADTSGSSKDDDLNDGNNSEGSSYDMSSVPPYVYHRPDVEDSILYIRVVTPTKQQQRQWQEQQLQKQLQRERRSHQQNKRITKMTVADQDRHAPVPQRLFASADDASSNKSYITTEPSLEVFADGRIEPAPRQRKQPKIRVVGKAHGDDGEGGGQPRMYSIPDTVRL